MENVLLVYGGDSYEHDISILTAIQIAAYMDVNLYRIIPCYINEGRFVAPCDYSEINYYISGGRSKKISFCKDGIKLGLLRKNIDIALLCCHGGKGENGALQGMLEMYNIPYTSADVLSSAICMNKADTHAKCNALSINTVDYVILHKNTTFDCDEIIKTLGDSLVVKPNSAGSSIGISFVNSKNELTEAIKLAHEFDDVVLIERKISNLIELNCACFATANGNVVSEVERPITAKEVLDFDDKYMSGGKMSNCGREFPAKINSELREKTREITEYVYRQLGLYGIVRIDFLYDTISEKLYLNEINTIPGSLAYYLFDDISPTYLLQEIIEAGIYRQKRQMEGFKHFKTDVLKYNLENRSVKLVK